MRLPAQLHAHRALGEARCPRAACWRLRRNHRHPSSRRSAWARSAAARPTSSRARRTRPVVALTGTTTVMRLPGHVHAGRRNGDFAQVATVVQYGEHHQGVGGQEATAGQRDGLSRCWRWPGPRWPACRWPRVVALPDQVAADPRPGAPGSACRRRCSSAVVARTDHLGVVVAVGVAADAHVVGAAGGRDEALRTRWRCRDWTEEGREQHLVARGVEDAQDRCSPPRWRCSS